ncbi:fungal specific transcription factor domain-containing protein [Fusarium oxysporum f. sp. phaseoli]
MTRALELAYKYCRDDKERLVVYVEEPWIQCIAVALFVVAGFNVGSIRSSDTGEEQFKIMDQWKNKASGLEILVANVNTKVRDVNAHTDCTKGLLLNWTLEPARMLKMINNMGSTNQKKQSIFHMLKVADTYHDVIERVCCTKWAMQLSKDIKLPEWMTGVVHEICIFELIKSTWHQQFNRYAWVVACDLKGHDFEYHDPECRQLGHVFSIVAKLMLHHPEDKEFWVESMPILMELCFHFKDAFDKSDVLDDEQASERREMLQRGLETRAKGHGTVAQGGEKRKAGDDVVEAGQLSVFSQPQAKTRNLKPARDCTNNFPSPNIRLFPPSHLSLHIRFRTLHRKTPTPDHQSMRPSEPERYIRSRIANACDGCKSRKVKCDGKLPCSYCTRRQKPHDCHYSPQRRRKAHSVRSPQTSERAQSTRHTTPSTPAAEPVRENGAQIDRDDGGQIDAEDETEVPREARLVCDAQGKLIFVGDCAPLSFFQSVRQLVTTRVGQNAFAPQSSRYSVLENATAHQSRRIPGDNRIPIVHPDDIPLAVTNYLSIATGLVDLFDNRRLQDDLILWANMDQKQDDATTIVNFLVLAIGMKINDEERSQDYFEYARDKAYSNLTGNLSVSTVQMFTLITLYMLCSCQINGAFLFFGTAVRAAYSIGIHRTEVNARFGPDIHRQRDRLWKSIRVVDLFLSSSMGRPPATSDVDCTVPYQSPDENVEEPVDLLNASVQIFLVLEGVVTEIYSRRKVSLQLTEGISLQLRDWSSRWLKQLKDIVANPEAQDRAQASGACQILATYYYAVMLVSRPFLMYELCRRLSDGSLNSNGRSALTSGKSKLADACIDAASLMVDPILDLIQKGILVGHVPILVSWLFASSLVLGVGLLGGFGRVLEKYTRMAIHALDHCSKHDTHAGQYSLIAQSLLTTALEYLEKRELAERQRRTENSSQLFGLIPSDTMDSSPTFTGQSMTTPSSRGRESLDRTFLQHNGLQHVGSPLFGDLDSAFLGLSESMMQTPDPSYWGGPMGNEADSGSALNLFALLDAGGGIDLTHHL